MNVNINPVEVPVITTDHQCVFMNESCPSKISPRLLHTLQVDVRAYSEVKGLPARVRVWINQCCEMTCSGCNIWPSVRCFMNHSCVYKCTATQLVSRQLRLPMKPKAPQLCEPYATFPGEAGSKQGSNTAAKPRLRTHTAYIIWKEVARLRAARSCARFPLLSISHATQQSVRTACVGIQNTLFLVVERWSRTLGIASGLVGSGKIECMCKEDKHRSGFWKVFFFFIPFCLHSKQFPGEFHHSK